MFPVAFSSLIARLPKGITPLAVVTLIHQTTNSYAIAGAIAAGGALGDALATPVQGRLLDRYGRGRVLLPSAVLYAVALALLPVLALRHQSIAVLWVAAIATLSGTVSFVYCAARVDRRAAPMPHRTGNALGVPAIRVLIAATLVQGLVFGALPVVLPGLAAHEHAPAVGGLLLAGWICGGVTGSLRRSNARYPVALARLSVALAVPALTALVTGGRLLPVAVAFGLAGLFLTPVAAASYLFVDSAAPPAHRTEAFTWLSTALALGGAAGSAIAGTAIDRLGVLPALFLPAVAAGLATATATAILFEVPTVRHAVVPLSDARY